MATPTSGTPGAPPEPFDWRKWGKRALIAIVLLAVAILLPWIVLKIIVITPAKEVQKNDGMATFGVSSHPPPTTNSLPGSSTSGGLRVQPYSLMELHSSTNSGVYQFAPGEKVKLVGAPTVQFRMSLNPRLHIYSPGAELGDGASSTNRVVFVENQSPGPESIRIIVEPK
jgi:hypothetical protein